MVEPHLTLDAHGRHAQCVLFARKIPFLLSGGQDQAIRLWSLPGFQPAGSFAGHEKSVNMLSLSEDERRLATASSDGTVRVWSFPEGEALRVFDGQVAGRIFPDGRRVLTLSRKGRAHVFDVENGGAPANLPIQDERLTALVVARDGRRAYVGGTGPIHRFDLEAEALLPPLEGHAVAVAALRLSPDGRRLASTGADGTLRFWSADDGAPESVVPLGRGGVLQLAFRPDGRAVLVSLDHALRVYSVPDGRLERELPIPVKGVYGVAISPDGAWLANAAADGRVRIFGIG